MIFVDTWAWIGLADSRDEHHAAVKEQHERFLQERRKYVTTDFVIDELITYLYRVASAETASGFVNAILAAAAAGTYGLVHLSPEQFHRTWELRQRFKDKPDISFTDFTSMVVMQDLRITDVFTGDAHFEQVGMGFHLLP